MNVNHLRKKCLWQVLAAKAESLLKLHRAKEALEFLIVVKNSEESKSRKSGEVAQRLLIIETQINLYLGRYTIVCSELHVFLNYKL